MITLPVNIADQIKFITNHNTNGFGSVRVKVIVGQSQWQTSIFPDNKSGSYLLPVKAMIRKSEKLFDNSECLVKISLV